MTADKPDDEFRGWLRSETVDATADYAARGRKHKNMSGADLAAAWVSSFRKLSVDFTNPVLYAVHADLMGEYELRAEEPPYHLVADDMDRFAAAFGAARLAGQLSFLLL
jgi:hypothetical protein